MQYAYSNAYFEGKFVEKNYSTGIYDAKGDLSKRWYLWWSFRNPKTGKLQRQGSIDTNINIHKTRKKRMEALLKLQSVIERGLEEGLINPYQTTQNTNVTTSKIQPQTSITEPQTTISEAFEMALKYAEKNYKPSSFKLTKNLTRQFERWTKEHKIIDIQQITRRTVEKYLNEIESRSSTRNRNNIKSVLSMIFSFLVRQHIIERNFIKEIPTLKTKPKRHKTYTLEQETDIFNHLEKNDKLLSLFIKFISFNMLRPVEVCRLQVKSLNIAEKKLYFEAKNKAYKTKIIPDILLKELPDLSAYDPDCHLFTPNGIAKTTKTVDQLRDHWSARFKKVVKDHFGLHEDHTMYSFRHTFITKLYNELCKKYAPFETKSRLMLITGHTSMSSLEKYLRDIDAALPEDYSEYLL